MRDDPRIGIELPLRILGDAAMIGYHDPRELSNRYSVAEQEATLEQMNILLVASEVAG